MGGNRQGHSHFLIKLGENFVNDDKLLWRMDK